MGIHNDAGERGMENLMVIGMVTGFIWGTAGLVGYPGVSWKPGALMTVACAVWLVVHDAMPPEPLIEAGAIFLFVLLNSRWARQFFTRRDERPKGTAKCVGGSGTESGSAMARD